MQSFIKFRRMTTAEWEALNYLLPDDTLVVTGDPGSEELRYLDKTIMTTGVDPVLDQTFVTMSDESSVLPNSFSLGSVGADGIPALLLNTPSLGTAFITALTSVPNSVLVAQDDGSIVFSRIIDTDNQTFEIETGTADLDFVSDLARFSNDLVVTANLTTDTLETTGEATLDTLTVTNGAAFEGQIDAVTGNQTVIFDSGSASTSFTANAFNVEAPTFIIGDTLFTGEIETSEVATLDSLLVNNKTTLNGEIEAITNNQHVVFTTGTGNYTVSSNTINLNGTTNVDGNTEIDGDLAVTGTISGSTILTSLTVNGSTNLNGQVTANTSGNDFTITTGAANTVINSTNVDITSDVTINGFTQFNADADSTGEFSCVGFTNTGSTTLSGAITATTGGQTVAFNTGAANFTIGATQFNVVAAVGVTGGISASGAISGGSISTTGSFSKTGNSTFNVNSGTQASSITANSLTVTAPTAIAVAGGTGSMISTSGGTCFLQNTVNNANVGVNNTTAQIGIGSTLISCTTSGVSVTGDTSVTGNIGATGTITGGNLTTAGTTTTAALSASGATTLTGSFSKTGNSTFNVNSGTQATSFTASALTVTAPTAIGVGAGVGSLISTSGGSCFLQNTLNNANVGVNDTNAQIGVGSVLITIGTVGASMPNVVDFPGAAVTMPNLGSGTSTALMWNSGTLIKATSSLRFKKDIELISFNTENLYGLSPKAFKYKDSGQDSWGYIAEEVEKLFPELVNYEVDEEDGVLKPFSLGYERLAIIAVEEIKKLNARIEALESKLG